MHRKITEHDRCCMQNDQLSAKSHAEVEDNPKKLSKFSNLIIYVIVVHTPILDCATGIPWFETWLIAGDNSLCAV